MGNVVDETSLGILGGVKSFGCDGYVYGGFVGFLLVYGVLVVVWVFLGWGGGGGGWVYSTNDNKKVKRGQWGREEE